MVSRLAHLRLAVSLHHWREDHLIESRVEEAKRRRRETAAQGRRDWRLLATTAASVRRVGRQSTAVDTGGGAITSNVTLHTPPHNLRCSLVNIAFDDHI